MLIRFFLEKICLIAVVTTYCQPNLYIDRTLKNTNLVSEQNYDNPITSVRRFQNAQSGIYGNFGLQQMCELEYGELPTLFRSSSFKPEMASSSTSFIFSLDGGFVGEVCLINTSRISLRSFPQIPHTAIILPPMLKIA
jgi:hypothetical protein